MKQPILMALLLGFGFLAPSTCSQSKKQHKKEEAKQVKPSYNNNPKQLALYGPTIKLITQQQRS
jgi:hypothetical protein